MKTQRPRTGLPPYLSSVLTLLILGVGFSFVADANAYEGREEDNPPESRADEAPDPLFYSAPTSKESPFHLAFMKNAPRCQDDRLFLFLNVGSPSDDLHLTEATLQFDMGVIRHTISLVIYVYPQEGVGSEIIAFSYPDIHPDFFRFSENETDIHVKIIAPGPLVGQLESIDEHFDISQLTENRKRAEAECLNFLGDEPQSQSFAGESITF